MKRNAKKRWLLLGVVTVIAGMAAFGAYAYWTASGTGAGQATVGSDSGVTINITNTGAALYPGGSATVTFQVQNNSSSSAVMVGRVVQDGSVTGLPAGCSAADFSFAAVTLNESIPASGSTPNRTGTLSMANTGSNQDACKNASPVLHLRTDNSSL
jgi:hypothetical protein